MRLDKLVACAKGLTRSEARDIISKGKITVNDIICRKTGQEVKAEQCKMNGESLVAKRFVYIMLNKPTGVVSASEGKGEITVVDLVKNDFPNRELFPAGRLDKTSTGFVLITDDGEFAHNILSPRHHVSKTYIVEIDAPLTPAISQEFEKGVTLADGTKLASAYTKALQNNYIVEVVLKQGVYHQIKRMFGVYDIGVNSLRRIAIGGLKLDESLADGEFRELTQGEVTNITTLEL